ncbi:unnamed protein product [Heligmosomoides polygyrus]|uniref:Uncharacterized protein n=1 Tax=Heligmosomoides polygyrus TaxID=6339 RepID=A0A183GMG2_HELPZ|nr:unnamed protein product [Heligmosomoides polygyrus]
MMQARKNKYDVIGLAETKRQHPLHAAYDSGEELFFGTCDSRGVGGVGVLVNAHLAVNIDSYESLTSRVGRLRLKRCGSVPALTVFALMDSVIIKSNYLGTISHHLEEKRYEDGDHLKNDLRAFFVSKSPDFYARGIRSLVERWGE